MALLQISEPGGAPDPHQSRIAIGIDLGTTHSLVAAVRHGVAECLPDEHGRVILPSAVRYLAGGRRQIGAAALADAVAIHRREALEQLQKTCDDDQDFAAAAEQVRALMFVERFAEDIDRRLEALGQ